MGRRYILPFEERNFRNLVAGRGAPLCRDSLGRIFPLRYVTQELPRF